MQAVLLIKKMVIADISKPIDLFILIIQYLP